MNISKLLVVMVLGTALWFMPSPEGLTDPNAWKLFAIFISVIVSVVINAVPLVVAAAFGIGIAILTKTTDTKMLYAGFSSDFIVLIIIAFILSSSFVKCGLGKRIAYMIISKFGSTSLGLAYSLVLADCIIAPAFPSNTARSGVLFPIYSSLALANGSNPEDQSRGKIGNFLMATGVYSLTISSAIWLTAMAANPVGAKMMADQGVVGVNFFSWLICAIVPSICAGLTGVYVLYKFINPEIKDTPAAPKAAREELKKLGSMSREEKIVATVFTTMVILWALSGIVSSGIAQHFDKTSIAFVGLGILFITGCFTLSDMRKQGQALEVFIWFSILFAMSSGLNTLGFMKWVGNGVAGGLGEMGWINAYLLLVGAYVLIHYFFVSQTAHMVALFGVFLAVGLKLGIDGFLLGMMLLMATNFFAFITPQGSSANILFLGTSYLSSPEQYKYGLIATVSNTIIYLAVGTPWILLIRSMSIV